MRKNILFAAVVPLVLAGCVQQGQEHLGPGFGDSVAHNKARHIIDPTPVYAGQVLLDGKRSALAMDRYEKGEVITPRDLRTSTLGRK